jgi:hypothetical protein
LRHGCTLVVASTSLPLLPKGYGSRPSRYCPQGHDVCKGASEAFVSFTTFALGLSTGINNEVIPGLGVNGVVILIFWILNEEKLLSECLGYPYVCGEPLSRGSGRASGPGSLDRRGLLAFLNAITK